MATSILIAKLAGPVLVVMGLAHLFNPGALRDLGKEILASRALVFIAGLLALVCGLAIVNSHNRWSGGWPVVITALGWVAIVAGIIRISCPDWVRSVGHAMLARPTFLRVASGIQVLLGTFLSFKGYSA